LGPLSWFIDLGGGGVDIFFVLSGYLITSILVSTKSSLNYFSAFYARRALRIFPLYFVVVGLFFNVCVPLIQHHGKDVWIQPQEQIWYWLFLANWRLIVSHNGGAQLAHFWSLAVEEQFYLIWSVVVWLLSPRRLPVATILLIAIIFMAKLLLAAFGFSDLLFIGLSTCTRMDTLLFGALLALNPSFRHFCARHAVVIMALAVLAALLLPSQLLVLLVYALGSTGLVAAATMGRFPLLRARWLRLIGKYSYGIYIIHYLVHGVLALFVHRFSPLAFALLSITLGIAVSCLLAAISWKVIEQPFLRLKKNFKYRFPAGYQGSAATLTTATAIVRPAF
jgi:peptidoglycan/LPS O-acetylase OafA/YrhL